MRNYVKNFIPIFFLLNTFFGNCQKLVLNKDGTAPELVFTIDKSASEIYNNALEWVNATYVEPELVLNECKTDSIIKIKAGLWNVFDAYKYEKNDKYSVNCTILLLFRDGGYTVKYHHTNFTLKSLITPLTIKELIEYKEHWKDAKEKYENKINQLLDSLNSFVNNNN